MNVTTKKILSWLGGLKFLSVLLPFIFGSSLSAENASERLLEQEFALSAGNAPYYLSFLARTNDEGAFRIEARRSDGLSRWGVRVDANGRIGAGMGTWNDSDPGIFESQKTYLVASKIVPGNPASVHVALFAPDGPAIPQSEADVNWIVSHSRMTGVDQDRFFLAVSAGRVELDELRFGTSWAEVVVGSETTTFTMWRSRYFTAAEMDDPSISGTKADPAGDGVPNLLSYAFFNRDPREPGHRLDLPLPELVDGELRLTYPERSEVSDVEYIPEVSTNLVDWNSDASRVAEIERVGTDGFTDLVTVAAVSPGASVFESFRFSGFRLDGVGSGRGWNGSWVGTTGGGIPIAQDGYRLMYPSGSAFGIAGGWLKQEADEQVASTRLFYAPIDLSRGNPPVYMSFLARTNSTGSFRIETNNADGNARWGVEVLSNGALAAKVTAWSASAANVFQADRTYYVASKFIPGNPATVGIKLFETGVDVIPLDDTQIQWDVVNHGTTGVTQDRLTLSVSNGTVELDDFRISQSWKKAVIKDDDVERAFLRVRVNQVSSEEYIIE